MTQAQICPAGYYCVQADRSAICMISRYCPAGSTIDTLCSPGYYCPNTTVQIACSAGYYSIAGSTSPTLCPAGSFCPNPNTLTPQVCSNIVFCTGMASGGRFNYDVSGYVVHQFLLDGTITFSKQTVADVLVIGGGGAGGTGYGCGGGGAGAVVYYPSYTFSAQTYDIAVGLGGAATQPCGEASMNGQDSSISLGSTIQFLAVGGGGGGSSNCFTSGLTGSTGGCSGGGGYYNTAQSPDPAATNWVASVSGKSPTTAPNYVFGSKGGKGDDSTDGDAVGGGGGGAGANGQDAYVVYDDGNGNTIFAPGNGGQGISLQALSTFGLAFTNLATLANGQYYIAGGGGGYSQGYYTSWVNDAGVGGVGGGSSQGISGQPNTGGGGGARADGGSGLVIVRYASQCSPPLVTYCPPGSASNTPCQPGYYCSTARTQLLCGLGNYCPEGSPSQIPCKTTSYCPDGSWQDICPTGMFIDANNGMCTSCPDGSNTAMPDMTLCS